MDMKLDHYPYRTITKENGFMFVNCHNGLGHHQRFGPYWSMAEAKAKFYRSEFLFRPKKEWEI